MITPAPPRPADRARPLAAASAARHARVMQAIRRLWSALNQNGGA